MLELLLDNKDGNVWDISSIASDISWKTTRSGRPASLEFTMIKNSFSQDTAFRYSNGDIIRFRDGQHNVFYGYIFSIDSGKDEDAKILAYDQVRYLLATDTYVFKNVTVADVVKQIADDFNLTTGVLADTGYRIPTMVEDGQTLLDIIEKAITQTIMNTNRIYVFFDDFGSLTLRNVEDMRVDLLLGNGSLIDYGYKQSIDTDTYNKVKLVRDNKETGRRDVYIAQDSANIARWGTLQLYQTVDEEKNAAQINELLQQLMALKNREARSLQLEAIGDSQVRAGCYVPVNIEEYGVNQFFLIDECVHRYDGEDHTMQIQLKVI
jgi:hypothetical protein